MEEPMRTQRFVFVALVITTAVLALGAANASPRGSAQPRPATASQAAGQISVNYKIKRFATRGHGLVAYGEAIARYTPGSAGGKASITRTAFRAGVTIHTRTRSQS
jgi:hypothetical protein